MRAPAASRLPGASGTGQIMKEANKEAAAQCLEVAERALAAGDLEKAERFVQKAQRLFSTDLVSQGPAMEFIWGVQRAPRLPWTPGSPAVAMQ